MAKEVIRSAPDQVIKAICNAALNAAKNPVIHLTPSTKNLFRENAGTFALLTNRQVPIPRKRKLLQTGSGLGLIPALLSSVIPIIGSLFLSRSQPSTQ